MASTVEQVARNLGFSDTRSLQVVVEIARHLRAGRAISDSQRAELHSIYPAIPPQYIDARIAQVNSATPAERVRVFAREVAGEQHVETAVGLVERFSAAYEREEVAEQVQARLQASEPPQAKREPEQAKREPDTRDAIKAAMAQHGDTGRPSREAIARRYEQTVEVLHTPEENTRRDTVAAAMDQHHIEAAHEEGLFDEADPAARPAAA